MAEVTDQNASTENAGAGGANPPSSTTSSVVGVQAADVQAQINQALTAQKAEFANQLKAATGHDDIKSLTDAQLKEQGKLQELADNKTKEAESYKQQFQSVNIANAILGASIDAIDPATVSALLTGKAVCDDNGNVTIDGKPVADAVKALLAEKPFLAKPQGDTGSGAPQNAGGGNQITRAEFEKLDHPGRAKFIQAGGKII